MLEMQICESAEFNRYLKPPEWTSSAREKGQAKKRAQDQALAGSHSQRSGGGGRWEFGGFSQRD